MNAQISFLLRKLEEAISPLSALVQDFGGADSAGITVTAGELRELTWYFSHLNKELALASSDSGRMPVASIGVQPENSERPVTFDDLKIIGEVLSKIAKDFRNGQVVGTLPLTSGYGDTIGAALTAVGDALILSNTIIARTKATQCDDAAAISAQDEEE